MMGDVNTTRWFQSLGISLWALSRVESHALSPNGMFKVSKAIDDALMNLTRPPKDMISLQQ